MSSSMDRQVREMTAVFLKRLSTDGVLNPMTDRVRMELRGLVEMQLLSGMEVATKCQAEQTLWKAVHYKPIEEYRRKIKELTSASKSTELADRRQSRRVMAAFRVFLTQATGFYLTLIHKLRHRYALESLDAVVMPKLALSLEMMDDFSNTGFSENALQQNATIPSNYDQRALDVVQKILISLGDMARYREANANKHEKNWHLAERFYRLALVIAPHNGNALNQLAVLSAFGGWSSLHAINLYLHSLSVRKISTSAINNLTLLLKKPKSEDTFFVHLTAALAPLFLDQNVQEFSKIYPHTIVKFESCLSSLRQEDKNQLPIPDVLDTMMISASMLFLSEDSPLRSKDAALNKLILAKPQVAAVVDFLWQQFKCLLTYFNTLVQMQLSTRSIWNTPAISKPVSEAEKTSKRNVESLLTHVKFVFWFIVNRIKCQNSCIAETDWPLLSKTATLLSQLFSGLGETNVGLVRMPEDVHWDAYLPLNRDFSALPTCDPAMTDSDRAGVRIAQILDAARELCQFQPAQIFVSVVDGDDHFLKYEAFSTRKNVENPQFAETSDQPDVMRPFNSKDRVFTTAPLIPIEAEETYFESIDMQEPFSNDGHHVNTIAFLGLNSSAPMSELRSENTTMHDTPGLLAQVQLENRSRESSCDSSLAFNVGFSAYSRDSRARFSGSVLEQLSSVSSQQNLGSKDDPSVDVLHNPSAQITPTTSNESIWETRRTSSMFSFNGGMRDLPTQRPFGVLDPYGGGSMDLSHLGFFGSYSSLNETKTPGSKPNFKSNETNE